MPPDPASDTSPTPSMVPVGMRLTLDRTVRRTGASGLLGGRPARLLTLSSEGMDAFDRLLADGVTDRPGGLLARRLLDAGIVHPQPTPEPAAGQVAVVVPVRDAATDLDRCLAALGTAAPVMVVDDASADAAAVARVAARHGAQLVRRERNGGPAAARTTGLGALTANAELVAFVDSDVTVVPGWLDRLAGHFADPGVAAVAPRVAGAAGPVGPVVTAVARFAAARSPLDLGRSPAPVRPGSPVAYVPTAALVVRRRALEAVGGFDEALRFGEDVDLVWRLHDAGWRVRYDPAVVVTHREPERLAPLLQRRFAYGRSAAPLARRHPDRLAPLRGRPWPLLATALAAGRRPGAAAAVAAVGGVTAARTMQRSGLPPAAIARLLGAGSAGTVRAAGRAAAQLALPAALALAALDRRKRLPVLAVLAADPLARWWADRPPLDPLRWTLLSLADEAAYGAGVWAGALRHRTAGPLLPRFG